MERPTSDPDAKRRRKLSLIGIKGITLVALCKVMQSMFEGPVTPVQQPQLSRLSNAEYQKVSERCYTPDVATLTFVWSSTACRR